jgi:hypothetical protein
VVVKNRGKFHSFAKPWARMFLAAMSGGNPLRDVFMFLYKWFRKRPVFEYSLEVGFCVFAALLDSLIGVELACPIPQDPQLELGALLASSLDEFLAFVKERVPLTFNRTGRIRVLPSVAEYLPNLHLRIQALQRVEDDAFSPARISEPRELSPSPFD